MGGGFAQVGILLVATVIGLPCFFFTLLALLDHFEQGLTNAPRAVVRPAQVVQLSAAMDDAADVQANVEADSETDTELAGAAVVALPVESPLPFTVNPARAATG